MNQITDLPAIFGSDVFNETVMRQRLAPEIFLAWRAYSSMKRKKRIDIYPDALESHGHINISS